MDMNFDKSTIRLHFFLTSSILVELQEDQRSIAYVINQIIKFQVFLA